MATLLHVILNLCFEKTLIANDNWAQIHIGIPPEVVFDIFNVNFICQILQYDIYKKIITVKKNSHFCKHKKLVQVFFFLYQFSQANLIV